MGCIFNICGIEGVYFVRKFICTDVSNMCETEHKSVADLRGEYQGSDPHLSGVQNHRTIYSRDP